MTYSFTYSDEGIRTSKSTNVSTTNYYYSGGLLIGESNNTETFVYIYDAEGAPIGIRYRKHTQASGTWTTYWFEKNVFGDIVAVYSSSGAKLISYKYDAWGNFTTTTHATDSIGGAAKNPFRYRGYYYDSDLGFYVTGTRYYDPAIGRFINADSALYHSMLGYNMYAYCENNPVNYVDYTGENAAAILSPLAKLAAIEPTIIGEVVLFVVAVTVVTICVVEIVKAASAESPADEKGKAEEAPQSVTEPESNEKGKSKKPSSPGKMQKEVDRGQAPKDVKRVHKAHNTTNGKPHVHFRNGSAMNYDGTPHDGLNKIPILTNSVKEWLENHNWSSKLNIF